MADRDARFEDAPASDRPLRLRAEDAQDLAVLSSLAQDAVLRTGDIRWMARRRRLVLMINRFRWEDAPAARATGRPFERVRTALTFEGVLEVRARGIDASRPDGVLALLALEHAPGEDGEATITLHFSGGEALVARVEMLDAALADLSRPWQAQAPAAPDHTD